MEREPVGRISAAQSANLIAKRRRITPSANPPYALSTSRPVFGHLQSERIRRDVRFNFWRDHGATLNGWPVGQANAWHRSSPFYSQLEARAAEGGVRRLSRVDDRSGRKADRRR
jgi:hypothetical protein